MMNYFYDLIDENNLPSGSRFIDPYDHTPFVVTAVKKETLPQLLRRIVDHREYNSYPTLLNSELRALVVANLYESSPPPDKAKYFVKRSTLPQFAQIASLSKALATQHLHGDSTASLQLRESRAKKCNDKCIFHDKSSAWSNAANAAVKYFAGISDLAETDEEKKLGLCRMCGGCDLKNKVKFSLQAVIASLAPEQIAKYLRAYGPAGFSRCWIMSEGVSNSKFKELLLGKARMGLGVKMGTDMYNAHLAMEVKKAKK